MEFRSIPHGNCPDCGGIGEIGALMDYENCETCDGTGDVLTCVECGGLVVGDGYSRAPHRACFWCDPR